MGKVAAFVHDRTAVDPAVALEQSHKTLCENCFAAAGFANDSQALAFIQIHGDAANRGEFVSAQTKLDDFVPDGKNCLGVCVVHKRAPFYTWFLGSAASAKALPIT